MTILLILIYMVLLVLIVTLINMSINKRISWSWPLTITPVLVLAALVVAWYFGKLPNTNYELEILISKGAGFLYLAVWGIGIICALIFTLISKAKEARIEKKYNQKFVVSQKQPKRNKTEAVYKEFSTTNKKSEDHTTVLIVASIVILLVGGVFNLRQVTYNHTLAKVKATYLGVTEYHGPEICGYEMDQMPAQEIELKPLFGYDIGQDKYLSRGEEYSKKYQSLKAGDKVNIYYDKNDPSIIKDKAHYEAIFIPCYLVSAVIVLVLLNNKGIINIKSIVKSAFSKLNKKE